MTDLPLVSIVTPSLNQGRFIGQTVESVLRQSYPSIEYVVLDAGSTDETHDVLRSFGDRVRWIVEPDRGQADAINKGWRATEGSVVAWLNADDLLEPAAVEIAVEALRAHPDAGAVYGDATYFDHETTKTFPASVVGPFDLWRLINIHDFIVQPTVFFRRSAVDAAGPLDDALNFGLDWDLLIRIGLRSPMVYVPQPLARVRLHESTKTVTGGWRRWRELVRIMRRYADESRPPAYWGEGLDTARRSLDDALDRAFGRHLPRVRDAVAGIGLAGYKFMAKRTFLAADQWFADGWAGPAVHLLVSPGDGPVVLRGTVPADLAPQTIEVRSAGAAPWSTVLAAGPFEVALGLPPNRPDGCTAFDVRALRWNTIAHPAGSTRRVAYRLSAVGR